MKEFQTKRELDWPVLPYVYCLSCYFIVFFFSMNISVTLWRLILSFPKKQNKKSGLICSICFMFTFLYIYKGILDKSCTLWDWFSQSKLQAERSCHFCFFFHLAIFSPSIWVKEKTKQIRFQGILDNSLYIIVYLTIFYQLWFKEKLF